MNPRPMRANDEPLRPVVRAIMNGTAPSSTRQHPTAVSTDGPFTAPEQQQKRGDIGYDDFTLSAHLPCNIIYTQFNFISHINCI